MNLAHKKIQPTISSENEIRMEQHTDIYTCGVCQQNEENLIEFLKHKLEHQEPGKGFVCLLCLISYTKETSLRQHYKLKHKVNLSSRTTKNNKKQNTLGVCTEINNGEKIIAVTDSQEINSEEKFCNSEMQNFDGFDGIYLFDSHVSDHLSNKDDHDYDNIGNKADHDYDKNTDEVIKMASNEGGGEHHVMELDNDIPPAVMIDPTMQTDTLNLGYLEMKPNNELSLCYADPLAINSNNTGIVPVENLTENPTINENDLVTCNIEIISLDQPSDELYIDDKGNGQDNSGEQVNDNKTEEHDFYFCIKMDVNNRKNVKYNRQDLMCIYCNYKDMVMANMYQHMYDNHQEHLATTEEIKLQDNADDVKVMKFSEYKKKCKQSKTDYIKRNRNTEKQDQAGEYPCTRCDKVFTRLRYLKKHVVLHKAEKPFLCDFCGKSFKTRTYLTIHHRSHAKKSFNCDQCDFSSSNPALIRLHRQEHNHGCILCDICGNAYSDKSTLTKHKRVHDPNRPYQCNYPGCTWRFLTEVMCRAHQRNHDTEGKFVCSHCGYAFRHKHHVKRHEAKVHGVKSQPEKPTDSINNEEHNSSVNVIVESTEESACIQETVPGGQLVITTDTALNNQLTDISNVRLMGSEEGRAIIIPQIDYGSIVLQRVNNSGEQDPQFIKVTELHILKENV